LKFIIFIVTSVVKVGLAVLLMKMRSVRFIFIMIAAALMHACEYQPSGIYERPVNRNIPPPEIKPVDINIDLESDTIYLSSDKLVNLHFKTSNQAIERIRLLVADKEVISVDSDNGSFYFFFPEWSEGSYKLTIEVYTTTGTGSMAEIMGTEHFLFSRSWTLIIDKRYLTQTISVVTNGYLTLRWPKTLAPDFKEYVITRYQLWNVEVEIRRLTNLEWTDSSYVGEGAHYSIKVCTINNELLPWGDVYLNRELPTLRLMPTASDPYKLTWTKPRFYNAVDTVKISETFHYYDPLIDIRNSHDAGDTVQVITGGLFGDRGTFMLKLVPKQGNIHYNSSFQPDYQTEAEYLLGLRIQNKELDYCPGLFQVSRDEFIFIAGWDSIKRYSVSLNKVVEVSGCTPGECAFCALQDSKPSSSGKYLTFNSCNNKFKLLNSAVFNDLRTFNLSEVSCPNNPSVIKVSDRLTGTINSCSPGFCVYDFAADSVLAFYRKGDFNCSVINFSPDGNYILLIDDSTRLVRFDGTNFNNISSLPVNPYNINSLGFDASEHDLFYTWDGHTFTVKHCSNLETVHEFTLEDEYILNIDFFNSEILSYTTGHMFVRSYITGDLINDIRTNMQLSGYDNDCYLINHAIACRKGIIYYIN
jgi:hypothetical protein